MENLIKETAERISSLREITGFSQAEMAEAAGITVAEYQSFEAGEQDFTFTFLYRCAEKFGVDMIELMTGENPRLSSYTVVRGGRGLPIKRRHGFEYYHLAANFRNKLSEPFLVRAPFETEKQNQPIELNSHKGQEFDYILSGKMRFAYETHTEELSAGDSVYYDSSKHHGMIAIDGEECLFLAMILRDPEEDEAK